MMKNIYETWAAGNGYIYLYTENGELYNLLMELTKNFARYERKGKVFAWHFLLEKDKLEFVRSEINKNLSIEN